jgi:TPR repeat protein/tRNA A-37 threonylcarbamoyl transferase component Bud32
MLAVRCPCCLNRWEAPADAARLVCPYCGAEDIVPTPAAAVETGFSLPLSSGTSVGEGCAPASVEGPHPFLAPPQAPGEIGRLGRYRVFRQLGAGGMGVVFEAEDSRLKRKVALKVMRPEAAADAAGRARFLREAEAAAALDHEHIVPVHDLGEENGAPFLVLPLLKGESLEDRLKRQRPLPLAEALRIAREMAEGLAAAHEAGLVHRDVKPANVWLTSPGGRVKLLDFGLARLAEGDAGMTRSGAVLGTPAYMAPEQIADPRKVDGRADLFSLGAVLYEMLAGRRAFPGQTRDAVLISVATTQPPAPHAVNPEVPPEVSALVLRLLEKAPPQRPSSARQVARQLGALAAPPAESLHLSRQGGRPPGRSGRRRWPIAAAALGLLVPLGLALAPWWRDRPAEDGTRPVETVADTGGRAALAFSAALHEEAREGLSVARQERLRRQAALSFGGAWHEGARQGLAGAGHESRRRQAAAFADALHEATWHERQAGQERRLRTQAALAFGVALSAAAASDVALRPSGLYARGMRLLRGQGDERDPKAAAGLLRQAAEAGHAPAQYHLGWLYAEGLDAVLIDNAEAVRWWRRAADGGHAPAQAELALSLAGGWYGVGTDEQEGQRRARSALPALRALAEQDDPDALSRLGQLRERGLGLPKDEAEAVRLHRRAAEQGDVVAQAFLGWTYRNGIGVARDEAEAVRWYRRAAVRGMAWAQLGLGWMYQKGLGVDPDPAEAVRWYRKAADQGYADGQNNLGIMYQKGLGVDRDHAEAVRWYRKAAGQGHADAQTNLGWMYQHGLGVARDVTEAVRWHRRSAEQGHAAGQNNLAWMYEKGLGVARDDAEAARWYRKAAVQGYANAQNNLGWMYADGRGVPKDAAEAVRLFRKAAEQGHAWAQQNMGAMYFNGQGVPKDVDEAVRWFRKALANPDAGEDVRKMARENLDIALGR